MQPDDEPVLTPSELLAYRRANGELSDFPAPRTVIFLPQRSLADHVRRHHATRSVKGFLGEFYLLKRTSGQIAISTNFGIGAPVIAGLTDEFAALGVKQFALIGVAGGLQPHMQTGSLVISSSALRGEGVSRHYLAPGPSVDSAPEWILGISEILEQEGQSCTVGTTWTTDAPFRELRRDVIGHQQQGVLAVDMEAAAMLSVAASLGLTALAMFSIADQLGSGHWRMASDLRPAQKGLTLLFDALYQYLTSQVRE